MGPVGDFLECYVSFRVCNTGTPLLLFSRHVLLLPVSEVLFSTTKAHWFKTHNRVTNRFNRMSKQIEISLPLQNHIPLVQTKKNMTEVTEVGEFVKKISKIVRTQRLTKDHPSPPITTHHPTLSNGMIQSGQCIYIYIYIYLYKSLPWIFRPFWGPDFPYFSPPPFKVVPTRNGGGIWVESSPAPAPNLNEDKKCSSKEPPQRVERSSQLLNSWIWPNNYISPT